jgi:hypothetical protein
VPKTDTELSQQYADAAEKITKQLPLYFDGNAYIEANNRTYDGAVILGLNVNTIFTSSLGLTIPNFLEPSCYNIASTVYHYNLLFTKLFPINNQDTVNHIPGILYGRYEGDTYNGGNAWINPTTNLATLYYNASEYILNNGLPSKDAVLMWLKSINYSKLNVDAKNLSKLLFLAGDSILSRIYYHTKGNDGNLYEQINKNNGFMLSSEHLSVNYSNILYTIHIRNLNSSKDN